ncbi:site-2 protease family protein [Candidatus Peregrinibacteria bacterium]|jgi:Zn-dependent protease|nr:site-2 protease family protein [Candidatus Peregrinibacteria bacterium]MBT7702696.1 site-2 protease family protein [Candidatus Peregrinibacteria bacterium]
MIDLNFIIALVVAITVHEFAHAWMANYLGDPTAKYHGRVTLNPLKHLDVFGTIMLFVVGLGWGKPVPVNPNNFKSVRRDSALVSFAGPASNILTAIVIALPYKYLVETGGSVVVISLLQSVFDLNLLLAIFNLLPLPPLDGSKIIGVFIPRRFERAYFQFLRDGIKWFIAVILIDSFVFGRMFGFSVLWLVIGTIYQILASIILLGT